MSFYNPYKKGPDFSQGINDFVGKMMMMMMMKQLFGKDPQRQTQEMANTPMPQPRGQDPMSNPMQDIIGQTPSQMQPRQMPQMGGQGASFPVGVGPPGMAQAGIGQGMMQSIMNNPQLMQMLMAMLQQGGGMMGPRR
uniref:Uncharacterized protein n=1 Tax=viral metagenome TaxID=1070528 RepID=A0A6H1ZKA8_9ZZZZ